MKAHITLEQWQSLVAVVEAGGYAQAAAVLHKGQSSVTYAVQKLQSQLGVKVFEIRGRKAVLTPTGELLYRRARILLEEAAGAEQAAKSMSAGWEAEIRIAAEVLFPTWLLLKSFERFNRESPHTRIELIESVLAGATELLANGAVDLAIAPQIPAGLEGETVMRTPMILVAHPEHPLHGLGRPVTMRDLRAHRQILVRESDTRRATRPLVEAAQRWTVGNIGTSIMAVGMGMGYARLPEHKIRAELHAGSLKPLPVRENSVVEVTLYLAYANRENAGPGTRRLAEIIREDTTTGNRRRVAGQPDPAV
jgi:DNA-binding transcriptional LysR family regulator